MTRIEDIKVIIPIGGEATRLRPLTIETSKATVRLLNRPLIEYTLIELARQGIKEIIFGVRGYVNYRSLFDIYQEGIGFSARYHIKPRVHFKYQPRVDSIGNADSVRINMEYYNINDPVLVVQGDNLFKLDVKKLLEYHEEKRAMMTIVIKPMENVEEFGVAELESDNKIRRFVEKPRREEAPSNLVNTGIYVLSPEIRKIFESEEVKEMYEMGKMDFGKDIIPYLIRKGYPVYAYKMDGLWFDVGTPGRYLDAVYTLLRELDDRDVHGVKIVSNRRIFVQGTSYDSRKRRAKIKRMYRNGELKLEGNILIGRHCQIGKDTYIEESSIDNFTIIGRRVKVVKSAVMDRVYIGDNAIVERSIVGRHVEIRSSPKKPTVVVNSVIADGTVVDEGTEIVNSKIYPHKVINADSKLYDTILT
ncbi:sugar phosphate nucleotidyltransferase [Sulfolobus acidocaldarius]|uniref:Glucose-1-phosphate adenylyltransferase n=4 Tax=Sulfolobus acidocaldarius TaxID=2285 RepID=Q4J9I2_SULAC|nr:NDP-sugar synthase [Sulfolobus acidocaldarius]AAY80546.1 glucose-1-phosphate adenylyltransferase [Sulfolobus acidocaldarius DSM 639]AGE71135.1 glucose-1-phosphate adenylyltransferase [Sulfolobus acidocaldarius N8]AGE73405.1 glucose-1-phosphate adenylyltransferase [Sulfolobus acidocaldarius Ron12/I]ALU28593.1 nucleotidyltransferase [Sulfolobus acidocaldarius]ALU31306.1 nucleotidyltransferase [Sulfolobus acidocaldarius]